MSSSEIQNHAHRELLWTPTPELTSQSYVVSLMKRLSVDSPAALRKASVSNISHFWDIALEDMNLQWYEPYTKTLDTSSGIAHARWFLNGKTNLVLNCLDRHLPRLASKPAILWEGDDGDKRELTYGHFNTLVCQTVNALKQLGVKSGDTVAILMPMLPETVVQLLACFKMGAVAIPIFSGFGAAAVASRLEESNAKVLFTSDVVIRRGKAIPIKKTADEATAHLPEIKRIVFRRQKIGESGHWDSSRDYWWHELVLNSAPDAPTEILDAEARSLIIFTSGTTGKPKGTVHTHAGCLATVGKEHRYVFNTDETSRFFWFTDIGWMMGPWEMIGVTLFGGTLFLYEGAPDFPTPSRLWELIDRYQLTILGISPTAIRMLMGFGDAPLKNASLDSLKLLGSTGEPWDPESYKWFFSKIGRGRCPILNISGGTEVMGCLLTPLPIEPLRSCSLGGPGLGVDADVLDEDGKSIRGGIGHLVCRQPLPSMTKGFLNDEARYLNTYFSKWKDIWYHGDWARIDENGEWYLHGRSDDTIKIAGKRVGPVEFESAVMRCAEVGEAAAVGVPDSLKGEVCVLYVVLKPGYAISDVLRSKLQSEAIAAVGKALAPKEVRFTEALPKTRSAKILRGIIRKLYLNEPVNDLTSVDNPQSLDAIRHAQ